MKFEGRDAQPPYMRAPEAPKTDGEREARAQLMLLYNSEAATLERYRSEGVPEESEEYRVVLERVNALGNALNGVPGMYEHIDISLSSTERIRILKKNLLEMRARHGATLMTLRRASHPNQEEIQKIQTLLQITEEQLESLDILLREENERQAEEARHRLPSKDRLPAKTGGTAPGRIGLGTFENALPSRDKSHLEKDKK